MVFRNKCDCRGGRCWPRCCRRCACRKNNEPCDASCGCVDCHNPLNGVDVAALSECALDSIEMVKALSADDLATLCELPYCPRCNRCTYGVSLPCEHCGARGRYADFA